MSTTVSTAEAAARGLARLALAQSRLAARALATWALLSLARAAYRAARARRALQASGEGKVAVVTGGASGVGRCTVDLLARKGWRVYCVDVNEAALAEVEAALHDEAGLDVRTARVDITDADKCNALRDRIDRELQEEGRAPTLDALVNCAGISFVSPTLSSSWDHVELQTKVNLLAPIRLSSIFKENLVAGPRPGAIVNVGSITTRTAWPWQCVYSATKFGLLGFVDSVRREILASNIPLRIHIVNPGPIDTPLVEAQQGKAEAWVKTNHGDPFAPGIADAARRHASTPLSLGISNRMLFLSPLTVAEAVVAATNDPAAPAEITVNAPLFWNVYLLVRYLPTHLADLLMLNL